MPAAPQGAATAAAPEGLPAEAARRRTFAIISHPDAGKTTLSEKLLLYSGAIAEAGAVKPKAQGRDVVSDWMELERERGISISSASVRFEFGGHVFNLVDTPGHRDFSEDTLRVLGAVDAAVILLDAAKGVEEQTLKLFEVARERQMPLITFINKFDRPGLEALELIDEIEAKLDLKADPVSWPVGLAGEFQGVIDARSGSFHRFGQAPGGRTAGVEQELDPAQAEAALGAEWRLAEEELGLFEPAAARGDTSGFLAGRSSPVLFGSALSNFGVKLLLEALIELAPAPGANSDAQGEPRPLQAPFSGLVFKVQSNLDPRHRDRLAFVRVCSGTFERGMKATVARTGRPLTLSYAHMLFGQQRATVDRAYPGDVVGLVNAGDLRVGDTLYAGEPVAFRPPPTLAPDHFATFRSRDAGQYKQFRKGLSALAEEGVVHVLYDNVHGAAAPVLAGAGPMQFEVARDRFEREYGAAVSFEPAPWHLSRSIDEEGAAAVDSWRRGTVLRAPSGRLLAAFKDRFELQGFERDHPEVALDPFLVH